MGAVPTSTLITVAPTGAETAKSDAPALPTTLDELVSTAKACEAGGAALIHIHVRAATDLVVQLSTGGAVTDPYDDRIRVLEALPDSCSLTCGTVNFGSDVFMNPWDFVVELYRRTQALEIVPEFELFDVGHVATLNRLLDKEGLPYGGHVHADLVLGVPGGAPGTVDSVVTMARMLPAGATWSATGVGRSTLPVALAALSAGGHLRVGMEDTLTFSPGRPVRDNAELVERAATLATLALRPPMTTDEARVMLNVSDRRNGVGS
jgi:3-keto-5-aminohexanoate cleavage enzyme